MSVINAAGTSQGGSSYVDRIIKELRSESKVTIIVGLGQYQDTVYNYISRKVSNLKDLVTIQGGKDLSSRIFIEKELDIIICTQQVRAHKATLGEYLEELTVGMDGANLDEVGYIIEAGTEDEMNGPNWEDFYLWYSVTGFNEKFVEVVE